MPMGSKQYLIKDREGRATITSKNQLTTVFMDLLSGGLNFEVWEIEQEKSMFLPKTGDVSRPFQLYIPLEKLMWYEDGKIRRLYHLVAFKDNNDVIASCSIQEEIHDE